MSFFRTTVPEQEPFISSDIPTRAEYRAQQVQELREDNEALRQEIAQLKADLHQARTNEVRHREEMHSAKAREEGLRSLILEALKGDR